MEEKENKSPYKRNQYNVPSVEEFINMHGSINTWYDEVADESVVERSAFEMALIEFAKIHVEAALKAASENVKWKEQITMQGLQITIIKSSILNAYNSSNIK